MDHLIQKCLSRPQCHLLHSAKYNPHFLPCSGHSLLCQRGEMPIKLLTAEDYIAMATCLHASLTAFTSSDISQITIPPLLSSLLCQRRNGNKKPLTLGKTFPGIRVFMIRGKRGSTYPLWRPSKSARGL